MDIIYNDDGETVVFARRDRFEHVAQISRALDESTTWGQFRANLPTGEWDYYLAPTLEEIPEDDDPFDSGEVPGCGDGDYPPWLAKEQLEWFPPDLIAKHGGEVYETVFNGTSLSLPANKSEQIAEDLRALGFRVERTDQEIY